MAVMQDFKRRLVPQFRDQIEAILKGGKECVARLDLAFDQGEVEVRAKGKGLGIDVRSRA